MSESERQFSRRSALKTIVVGAGAMTALPLSGSKAATSPPETREVRIRLQLDTDLGPINTNRYGVGHGGLTDEPIWLDRAANEIRALNPKVIRLFVQEYYDLLPARGQYNWKKLDASVDVILKTGAKPLMCICFRPKVLYPDPDFKIVEPNDWEAWEELVYQLVRHYKEERGGIGWYWEVGNEPPQGGATPYEFTLENYVRYYQHTVAAVRQADPEALVGGPAGGLYTCEFIPALISFCDREKAPLDFISWHWGENDMQSLRTGIESMKKLLSQAPSLRTQTIIDEWSLPYRSRPYPQAQWDPAYNACYMVEVMYQMLEASLDHACYYQIRDYMYFPEVNWFLPGDMSLSWEHDTIASQSLFDFQNSPQSPYFAFRFWSRLIGNRLRLESSDNLEFSNPVHGLAAYDKNTRNCTLLLWNFSDLPAHVELTLEGAPSDLIAERVVLNARAFKEPEFHPLYLQGSVELPAGNMHRRIDLEPYDVVFWGIRKK